MKLLVCGDHHWTDVDLVREVIFWFPVTAIIEGGAKGADRAAYDIATEEGLKIFRFNAQWDKYGRAAGPIRNREMLQLKPDLVIAFHDDLEKSKGTKNMVTLALEAGYDVILVNSKGEVEFPERGERT